MGLKQLSEINGLMLAGSGRMGGNRKQDYDDIWYYGCIGLVTLVATRQSRCPGTSNAGQQASFLTTLSGQDSISRAGHPFLTLRSIIGK
jgi:hypothetical protein